MLSTYRFVGLLLVTKLLSNGDIPVIKAVYDAVGIHFINRLLLPLGRREVTNTEMVLWRLQSVLLDQHNCLVSRGGSAHSCEQMPQVWLLRGLKSTRGM